MIRRTSLGNQAPRRHSTPASLSRPSNGSGIPDLDPQGAPFGGEVRFLPLRQVLDGRVKRRIRRNGLSEEMNAISAEKRRRAEETKAEIERLKAELAEKDEEIERMHDETVVLDTERVWGLEQEVAALKRELASRSSVQQLPSSPAYEWTRAARDPFSDDFMDLDDDAEDEDFGEATRAQLLCSTPTRRMRPSASFPTPPSTSPEPQLPLTPCRRLATPPRASAAVQASLPDLERRQLEEELESLRLEVNKLTTTLESYSTLTSRLSEKLTPFSPQAPSEESAREDADLETRLTTVLQTLSDRTAALTEVDSSLQSLGFPGSDAFEVIDALRAGFRSARLELEYLDPGEVTIPLTGAGAEVLSFLLTQLRALAQKAHDADSAIDEYHALELSLRQQLSARVTAMDTLTVQLTKAKHAAATKDAHIADLDLALDRLKTAARAYTRDIAELEALATRLDADLAEKTTAVARLETSLSAAREQTTDLGSRLAGLSAAHAEALHAHETDLAERDTTAAGVATAHEKDLAERDKRVVELGAEVERVGGMLCAAQEAVGKLSGENDALRKEGGVARGVWAELERVVKMGEGVLGTVATEGEDEAVEQGGRASKKRRLDSGLGFLDEEVVEGDA